MLTDTGKLPVKELADASGVERKTIERHRRYIVAMLLAYTNGFDIIRGHLNQVFAAKGHTALMYASSVASAQKHKDKLAASLAKRVDCRYTLIVEVAKRARQIIEQEQNQGLKELPNHMKEIAYACHEIEDGTLQMTKD